METIIAAAGGAGILRAWRRRRHGAAGAGGADAERGLAGIGFTAFDGADAAGIPVGTVAIGKPGAINAALLAVAILANSRPALREKLHHYRDEQKQRILKETLP